MKPSLFCHFTDTSKSCMSIYVLIHFSSGIPELRQAICEFHQHHDKLQDLDPDRVIVGPGTKELIFLLMTVFNGGNVIKPYTG